MNDPMPLCRNCGIGRYMRRTDQPGDIACPVCGASPLEAMQRLDERHEQEEA